MNLQVRDLIDGAVLIALLGIYYRLSIMTYQHRLMWTDFAKSKGLDPKTNGKGLLG